MRLPGGKTRGGGTPALAHIPGALGLVHVLSCFAGLAEALQTDGEAGSCGSGTAIHSRRGSCEPSTQFWGFRPGLCLKLPLPTSCSLNMRQPSLDRTALGSGILGGVAVPLTRHGQGLVSAHGSHNGKRRHGEPPKTLARWVGGPTWAGDGGEPLPERAVLKQGALTPHH